MRKSSFVKLFSQVPGPHAVEKQFLQCLFSQVSDPHAVGKAVFAKLFPQVSDPHLREVGKAVFAKLFPQVPRSSNSQKHKFCRVIFASLRQSEKQFLQSLFLQVVGPRAVGKSKF